MADYEVLAPGGHENLINNVTERLDEKAYIDGYYQQLTAGAADNLTGRGDGVNASYLYRTTGGDADVADGTATVKSIHGRTLVWNQLGPIAPVANQSVTSSVSDDVVTLTVSTSSSGMKMTEHVKPDGLVLGHKYLALADVMPNSADVTPVRAASVVSGGGTALSDEVRVPAETVGSWTRISTIGILSSAPLGGFGIRVANTAAKDSTVTYKNFMLFDLTQMFGSGNEPSTVAEFEAMYPEPYYEYDAGSLMSVQMEGIETVGFNAYDPTTGTAALLGGNAYQITGTYTALAYSTGETLTPDNYGIFTPTANGTLTVTGGNATDTCVHLVWSGYRNGEYEPYWQQERTIPATDLRSAGTVYDELTATERITRIGEVDLGTLTWVKRNPLNDGTGHTFTASCSDASTISGVKNACACAELYCTPYKSTWEDLTKGEVERYGVTIIAGGDSSLTGDQFKASMSGVILYYALATPTTTPNDPPLNLSYRVSDFGTERVMHTAPSAAPTMQVVYGLNVVDTVRRLPTEYISHDSFTQFRIALGAKLGVFIIETWDETDGRYEYTINDA